MPANGGGGIVLNKLVKIKYVWYALCHTTTATRIVRKIKIPLELKKTIRILFIVPANILAEVWVNVK